MFQNDKSWIECVKLIENSFEIYQVLYSRSYSCEPWTITFDRPLPCGLWTIILTWTIAISYVCIVTRFGVLLLSFLSCKTLWTCSGHGRSPRTN